ncbi:MAG: acyltransferase family protein [Deltaproteobacteria bacterium]|nr:acyltransferase family protein [Deltaproteobacteria bacterium]
MNPFQRAAIERLARQLVGDDRVEKLRQMPFNDLGFGYDQFGFERESALLAYLISRLFYLHYFRVESRGHGNIPAEGRTIVAANHSGLLPIDGVMIGCDLIEKLDRPRPMRAMVDNFVPSLPFIWQGMARAGQVVGSRRNFEELLKSEELVTVFPEGTKGIGKLFRERYRLKSFNVGFVELALQNQTPIVPAAVVGAEEQAPILGAIRASWVQRLGMPFIPLTPTFPLLGPLGLLPLPVKYHIRYGERLEFHREYGPDAASRPEIVKRLAEEVQQAVQDLVNEGLKERKGIFR